MSTLKDFLADFNIWNLPFWAFVISVVVAIIYLIQLNISKRQTKIIEYQNDPILIFIEQKMDKKKNKIRFLFENIGHVAKQLRIYITDEIFISRDLSSGVILFENAERLPIGVNLRVNGRFGESKPVSLGSGTQRIEIMEDNSEVDIKSFINELMQDLNCSVFVGHRVIMSYMDFNGTLKKENYLLISDHLYKEDSDEYKAYDFMRDYIIDYDIRLYNKTTILSIVKKKLDNLC